MALSHCSRLSCFHILLQVFLMLSKLLDGITKAKSYHIQEGTSCCLPLSRYLCSLCKNLSYTMNTLLGFIICVGIICKLPWIQVLSHLKCWQLDFYQWLFSSSSRWVQNSLCLSFHLSLGQKR